MWLVKSLVGDRPSWHKKPINFFNKMLSIRKVRLLITSRYIAMQSYECVIISKMFLICFIYYGCNGGALVFLGGAEASASPSFALPMFITIKKIIILHLFLGVPAATLGGTGTPWHTRGYAPDQRHSCLPLHRTQHNDGLVNRAVKLTEKLHSHFLLKYYQNFNYIRIYKAEIQLGKKSFWLLSWGHKRAHRPKYYQMHISSK